MTEHVPTATEVKAAGMTWFVGVCSCGEYQSGRVTQRWRALRMASSHAHDKAQREPVSSNVTVVRDDEQ